MAGLTSVQREREHARAGEGAESVSADLFAGGGEMGAIMRATDWSATRLGPVQHWPQSLKTMLGVVLGSRFPMLLWWGPELLHLYNDAYRPILRDKHPASLGAPAAQVWAEVWDVAGPMARGVQEGGPATWTEDLQLFIHSGSMAEETYFTFSYSPVPGDDGRVGGLLNTVQETTAKVQGERQIRMLHDLVARAADATSEHQAYQVAAEVLSANALDLPFVLLYVLNARADEARLVAANGLEDGDGRAQPACVRIEGDEGSASWPLAEALRSAREVVVDELASRFGPLPVGRWNARPERAIVLPLYRADLSLPYAFLVAGISPHRALDDRYLNFFRATADQVTSVLANARAYEAEKKRAEALAEVDRAKTDFFSNVSHELRTPLTLILGPTETLLRQHHANPETQRQLDVIARNARTLLRHVNDLLDIAKLEAGKTAASYAQVDLARLLRLSASHFEAMATERLIAMRVHAPAVVPAQVDVEKMQRVLLNLLGNAFKFTPDGGKVTCRLETQGSLVRIVVDDSGPGVAAELREAIFERFRQAEQGAARRFGGTGLGLAIAREFLQLHAGTIRAEASPEGGARFVVELPIRAPAGVPVRSDDQLSTLHEGQDTLYTADLAPIAKAEPGPGDSSRPLVLVIEDNREMNRFIAQALAGRYRVACAYDGAAGLVRALALKPDLIVSDVMMPRMTGEQLVRGLRMHAVLDAVPIIMLTAKSDDQLRVTLLREGVQDYLSKPFQPAELLARVANLLAADAGRRSLRSELASRNREMQNLAARVRELESMLAEREQL
ncbi:MAG TPA: ATP-binding protein [Albitalea sp.]|nr:ATP-binding protein [Albitalea sp.]